MSETSVASRAQRGAFSLFGRQLVLFPVGVVTGIILARLLAPEDFGEYASATFMVMTAGALLEFGLGAIVIQQPEEPTGEQLRAIFTAQLAVFGFGVLLTNLLAPLGAALLHLPADGAWLIRAMSLHMLMGCLGTNSTLLLERRMAFATFARLDIVTVLTDRGLTLLLAFMHFGAWSFVIGSLVSMGLRIGMLLVVAPWPLGFAYDRAILARALRFGLTLQATNLAMVLRENLNTLVGGGLYGPRAVGYLNWGMNLPSTCANWLVQIVGRVSYPAFARLHDQPEERGRMLDTSLRALNLLSYPPLLVLIPLGPHIVTFVYKEAWRPALFALGCFVVRTLCTNVNSVLVNFLNATGHQAHALRIATYWTLLETCLALGLAPFYGFNGVAIAYAVGPFPALAAYVYASHRVNRIDLVRVFGVPLLAGGLAALAAFSVSSSIGTLVALVAALLLSAGVAILVIALCERTLLHQTLFIARGFAREFLRESEPVAAEA